MGELTCELCEQPHVPGENYDGSYACMRSMGRRLAALEVGGDVVRRCAHGYADEGRVCPTCHKPQPTLVVVKGFAGMAPVAAPPEDAGG